MCLTFTPKAAKEAQNQEEWIYKRHTCTKTASHSPGQPLGKTHFSTSDMPRNYSKVREAAVESVSAKSKAVLSAGARCWFREPATRPLVCFQCIPFQIHQVSWCLWVRCPWLYRAVAALRAARQADLEGGGSWVPTWANSQLKPVVKLCWLSLTELLEMLGVQLMGIWVAKAHWFFMLMLLFFPLWKGSRFQVLQAGLFLLYFAGGGSRP